MDRREFLKQVSLYCAGILLTPPVFRIIPESLAAQSEISTIAVGKGENYIRMVSAVIETLGGMRRFVKPSDTVVIKPNIGWDRSVEQGANTHPDIVTALSRLCLDAGAAKVKIFDRTCNEERRCYNNSGIQAAVSEIGDRKVKLTHIDRRRFVPVNIEKANVLKQWDFYRDALEADVYINVPVAKHHGLSGLSLGLKNIMGVIGGRRGSLHYQLAEKLADLNTVIRPSLTFVDATRVIIRNGPQGGRLDDVRVLHTTAASTDPVAADAYATTLFGMHPSKIDSTVAAAQAGLGQMDLEKCRIVQARV